jgi:GH43 family beta-xylosidase
MTFTYTNPVWPGYFADPFVLKWRGEYYAYGTGPSVTDERTGKAMQFPILRSRDLVNWEPSGGAMESLADSPSAYWAPEVAEWDGRFYLYYSAAAGGDENQRLRVAVADHPAGPFVDSGLHLFPDEGFTIDASPFRDPKDGRWYLFFARDYFDERVGTGTAVVPLEDDMVTPADAPRSVIRASADWQVYERNRHHYGQTWEAWHTVEGPSVLEHEGLYYCFYSGGAWHSENYGVSYGVAEHPLGPYRDEWCAEGPAVLKGIPGKVLGPGHNSFILGPDDRTLFMVYHAWDPDRTARRMCIDPLEWTPDGPRVLGPTYEPQRIDSDS